MKYLEFKPSAALAPYIDCYWYKESLPTGDGVSKCIPSGSTDIIITLNESTNRMWHQGQWVSLPKYILAGIRTEPVILKVPTFNTAFGIRIKPEAFVEFFRMPLKELSNDSMEVEAVLDRRMVALSEQIVEQADNTARVALCEAYFLRMLNQIQPKHHYLAEALQRIRRNGGQLSTEALSRQVFVGERQLQRAFREYFGISPKTYSRIMRFNRANYLLLKKPQASWADISYTCGYSDQAHFIREFKTFTGAIPTATFQDAAFRSTLPMLEVA
ncbi:MAG: helix-turn-helix transcriptional regulator [Saprospiraceae bacterium]|nr:helix-turn-helix transcriptional regulator [Saprospiraceae bacterium]